MICTKTLVALALFVLLTFGASGQGERVYLDSSQVKGLTQVDSAYQVWYSKMSKRGVSYDSTSFTFDDETKKIIRDPIYRFSIYKNPYTWNDVKATLKKYDTRLAFWQMTCLYQKNKKQVVKYILAYDKAIPADTILASAFYTYAMLDPRITYITSDRPEIRRPDILEDLFKDMNEIIDAIYSNRRKTAKKQSQLPR